MENNEREELYRRALSALRRGFLTEAGNMFAELVKDNDNDARFVSYRGLLMAISERRVCEGAAICKRAITLASSEPDMHLNLARLYSSTGQINNAVQTLREAIRSGVKTKAIKKEIQRLSPRAEPPIPSLPRDHYLNDILGKLLARILRRRVTPPEVLTRRAPSEAARGNSNRSGRGRN